MEELFIRYCPLWQWFTRYLHPVMAQAKDRWKGQCLLALLPALEAALIEEGHETRVTHNPKRRTTVNYQWAQIRNQGDGDQ